MTVYIAFRVGDDLYEIAGVYMTLTGAQAAHPGEWIFDDEYKYWVSWENPTAHTIEAFQVIE